MIESKQISNFRFKNYIDTDAKYYFLLLTIFFILCAIGMVSHEMWRDELEAWLISRDSNSISELFSNLTYTGHPSLWYLCLYFLAKITHNPQVMQLFHLIIITCLILVFLYCSGFDNLQKTLFCFGYFPLYEYGVISRNYSLGILFIFIFCALYCRKKRNYLLLSIALLLASHTNIYSLIISFVLALVLFIEPIAKIYFKKEEFVYKKQLIIGLFIYLLGLLTATKQIIRASSALSQGELGLVVNETIQKSNFNFISFLEDYLKSSLEFEKVVNGIWRSYIPVPNLSVDSLWGTNFLTDNQQFFTIGNVNSAPLLALLLSFLLFAIFMIIFASQLKILFIYVCGTLTIITFGFVARIPALRHNGHLFILLIVCYWLFIYSSTNSNSSFKQKYLSLIPSRAYHFINIHRNIILSSILAIQFYAGIKLYILDLVKPFSNVSSVVQFIQNNKLEDAVIVASSDLKLFPLSAWLEREIYYPEIADFGTFTVWTPNSVKRDSDISQAEIIKQAQELRNSNENILLITDNKLQPNNNHSQFNLVTSLKQESLIKEEYYIYSLK